MAEHDPGTPQRRRSAGRSLAAGTLRWGAGIALALLALVATSVLGLLVLANRLDRPWAKRRVQARLHSLAGVDVDYASLRVEALSGLTLRGLVLRAPPAWQAVAPELVRLDLLEVRWSPWHLFRHAPPLTGVRLRGLALTVAKDEAGRSSLDGLSAPEPKPQPPGAEAIGRPLSRLPGWLLAALPRTALEVEGVTITLLQVEGGRTREREELRGLGVQAAVTAEPALTVQLGTQAAPLALALERSREGAPAGSASLELWGTAVGRAAQAEATLNVRVLRQTLSPSLRVDQLLHLGAVAAFDVSAGRTQVELRQLAAADGAAGASGTATFFDAAGPREQAALIQQAAVHLDLDRAAVLLSALGVPIESAGATLDGQLTALRLGPSPRLEDGGQLSLDGKAQSVSLRFGAGGLRAAGGSLSIRQRAAGGATSAAEVSLSLETLKIDSPAQSLLARGVGFEATASPPATGGASGWSGRGTVRCESLVVRGAAQGARVEPSAAEARGIALRLSAEALRLAPLAALKVQGAATLEGRIESLALGRARLRVRALTFGVHAPLPAQPPFSLKAEAAAGELALLDSQAKPRLRLPAAVTLELSAVPDFGALAGSRASAEVTAEVGVSKLEAKAQLADGAVDYDLSAVAPSLGALAGLCLQCGVAWDRLRLELTSKGRLEGVGSETPALRQHADLRLGALDASRAGVELSARAVNLGVSSQGTAAHQSGSILLTTEGAAVGGAPLIDQRLAGSLDVEVAKPAARFDLELRGGAEVEAKLAGELARAAGVTRGRLEASVRRPSLLSPLLSQVPGLSGLDLGALALTVQAKGALHDRARSAAGEAPSAMEGTADVTLSGLRWAGGDRSLATPAAALHASLGGTAARQTVALEVTLDQAQVAVGARTAEADGFASHLEGTFTGGLSFEDLELRERATLNVLHQSVEPAYPIADLTLAATARRGPGGGLRVSDLRIENAGGGTSLAVDGTLRLEQGRGKLALSGQLQQDLSKAWREAETFSGSGKVAVAVRLESPDLAVYRAFADVALTDVNARFPRAGVTVEGLEGKVPIDEGFLVEEGGGVRLLRDGNVNAYAQLRFADQHPMIRRSSYFSLAKLVTPDLTVAPVAGNFQVEDNVVSLSQIELGLRGGQVTGQCTFEWAGNDSSLQARLRANGVLSSHGEPFDGNAALVVSVRERSIDGRIEVLKIGRRHLLDLLDLQDPHRIDPAVNRIRRTLDLGYPDRVHLSFDHGFASVRVDFGGLAGLVKVRELRGIPVEPLVDRIVNSLSKSPETR